MSLFLPYYESTLTTLNVILSGPKKLAAAVFGIVGLYFLQTVQFF